jgi:hypothetical protein
MLGMQAGEAQSGARWHFAQAVYGGFMCLNRKTKETGMKMKKSSIAFRTGVVSEKTDLAWGCDQNLGPEQESGEEHGEIEQGHCEVIEALSAAG